MKTPRKTSNSKKVVDLTPDNVSGMKVNDLKMHLSARKLSTNGLKADLASRLIQSLEDESSEEKGKMSKQDLKKEEIKETAEITGEIPEKAIEHIDKVDASNMSQEIPDEKMEIDESDELKKSPSACKRARTVASEEIHPKITKDEIDSKESISKSNSSSNEEPITKKSRWGRVGDAVKDEPTMLSLPKKEIEAVIKDEPTMPSSPKKEVEAVIKNESSMSLSPKKEIEAVIKNEYSMSLSPKKEIGAVIKNESALSLSPKKEIEAALKNEENEISSSAKIEVEAILEKPSSSTIEKYPSAIPHIETTDELDDSNDNAASLENEHIPEPMTREQIVEVVDKASDEKAKEIENKRFNGNFNVEKKMGNYDPLSKPFSKQKIQRPPPPMLAGTDLVIDSIPEKYTDEELLSLIKVAGFEPTDYKLYKDKDGKSMGVAWIRFSLPESARSVADILNGKLVPMTYSEIKINEIINAKNEINAKKVEDTNKAVSLNSNPTNKENKTAVAECSDEVKVVAPSSKVESQADKDKVDNVAKDTFPSMRLEALVVHTSVVMLVVGVQDSWSNDSTQSEILLKSINDSCGGALRCEIVTEHNDPTRTRGMALVLMRSSTALRTAEKVFTGNDFRKLGVEGVSVVRSGSNCLIDAISGHICAVYVSNVPNDCQESTIRELFDCYGPIEKLVLRPRGTIGEDNTDIVVCFAIVNYENHDQAMAAVIGMNCKKVLNNTVQVSLAKPSDPSRRRVDDRFRNDLSFRSGNGLYPDRYFNQRINSRSNMQNQYSRGGFAPPPMYGYDTPYGGGFSPRNHGMKSNFGKANPGRIGGYGRGNFPLPRGDPRSFYDGQNAIHVPMGVAPMGISQPDFYTKQLTNMGSYGANSQYGVGQQTYGDLSGQAQVPAYQNYVNAGQQSAQARPSHATLSAQQQRMNFQRAISPALNFSHYGKQPTQANNSSYASTATTTQGKVMGTPSAVSVTQAQYQQAGIFPQVNNINPVAYAIQRQQMGQNAVQQAYQQHMQAQNSVQGGDAVSNPYQSYAPKNMTVAQQQQQQQQPYPGQQQQVPMYNSLINAQTAQNQQQNAYYMGQQGQNPSMSSWPYNQGQGTAGSFVDYSLEAAAYAAQNPQQQPQQQQQQPPQSGTKRMF